MKKETFGEYIRILREKEGMPLRKLAARLDIDQSTLSKIERNERQPTKKMVPVLARVFKLNYNELKIKFLSEKITYELKGEELGLEALKVAEQAIEYVVNRKKRLPDKKSIITKITPYFKTLPIEKAWLFGSYVRDEQDIDSDIDIMVRFTKPNKIDLFDYAGIIIRLEELLGIKTDLVEDGLLQNHAVDNVEKEKIMIYERKTKR